jgi:hypothetical protein
MSKLDAFAAAVDRIGMPSGAAIAYSRVGGEQ